MITRRSLFGLVLLPLAPAPSAYPATLNQFSQMAIDLLPIERARWVTVPRVAALVRIRDVAEPWHAVAAVRALEGVIA